MSAETMAAAGAGALKPEDKRRVLDTVREHQAELIGLSERLHANPELGWQEHQAAEWTASYLESRGFAVERGYLGFDTAIRAVYGSGSRRVGLMAEYDALPGLGHACGHNIITAMSCGAAVALSAFADARDLTVEVYGTPAEEGGGGKIELLKKGAFRGLDLAMMAHPSPVDSAEASPYAVAHNHVVFEGKAAHAAAYPEQGINANDAFIVSQVALGLLRQQLPSQTRVHGVQTRGGEAPNAIPERTEGRWYVRAQTLKDLEGLESRVARCFEAGALATGCELTITPESEPYSEFRTEQRALDIYVKHALELGRRFDAPPEQATMNRASTDMGNVSQVVPAIHPYIGLGCYPVANHQKEFAAHCVGDDANRAIHDGSVLLALTGLDYLG
ncbi:M20 family metallopeptidase [Paeniglutamicibacter psychrophenolicus]|uniref:M20 family metallopeptidase n=1 Tax=Paeniglutamicibacter psychrophenolicus TaxID=257454 RepID=UPI002787DAB7|nr:M20 family metallopeptidase [Paeniglutamicibacter psychrophenolicus]MDQ0092988.1 amidohydrolase [Paeniglutamicibacter psychrophenolicus]